MQDGLPLAVDRVDVGAELDEELDEVGVALPRRQVEAVVHQGHLRKKSNKESCVRRTGNFIFLVPMKDDVVRRWGLFKRSST